LTGARTNSLDVSASAFVLMARNYPGLIDTFGAGIDQFRDVSSVEYLSVPTALVYVRKLSENVTFGGGLFVPTQDEIKVEDVVRLDNLLLLLETGDSYSYEQRLGFTSRVRELGHCPMVAACSGSSFSRRSGSSSPDGGDDTMPWGTPMGRRRMPESPEPDMSRRGAWQAEKNLQSADKV
jgi:hypothetical protein